MSFDPAAAAVLDVCITRYVPVAVVLTGQGDETVLLTPLSADGASRLRKARMASFGEDEGMEVDLDLVAEYLSEDQYDAALSGARVVMEVPTQFFEDFLVL